MSDWTEKYRPQTLDGVLGNPTAVNTLRTWAKSWANGIPQMRAVVLMGPPGIGKTTSAEALAREMGWDMVEMNSSDQRTAKDIESVAVKGSRFNTFSSDGTYIESDSGGRKLIILDEADSFFGNKDRGALPAINQLIRTTRQPIILIVNDFYALSSKSSVVKNETLQITFKRASASTIAKALYRIADAEGVDVEPEAMEIIAANASGDMRAAVRNLESLALGSATVTVEMAEGLSDRADRKDMYDLMSAVFRRNEPLKARRVLDKSDLELDTVLLWVDENLPYEYTDRGDLVRGYEKLSRADIFLGRIHRRQYYRFMVYAGDMMTAGVASARRSERYSRDRIKFPTYLSKMSRSKAVRNVKSSVCLKLATGLHTSTRRVSLDVLPSLKVLLANDPELRVDVAYSYDLEPEDMGFLLNKKADSKEVKAVFKQVDERREARRLSSQKASPREQPAFAFPLEAEPRCDPEDRPPEPSPAPVPAPTQPRPRSKGVQRSLFDF